ncbi:MAG: DUF932 domain-containing protein [bacterium]
MDKLEKFMFPVEEKRVYFEDKNGSLSKTDDYKAIMRVDTNSLVSIMQDTYHLVPNRDIIMPLMDQLNNLDSKWIIDPSHSYVENSRMRLQVTFPDLTFSDGESDIALSLFLHNSYDGSEGVRMFWGAIRGICTNGMVFGKVLSKYYSRHTSGIQIGNIKQQVEKTYEQIPIIKNRIDILQNIGVKKAFSEAIEEKLGVTVANYVRDQPAPDNQWILYNYLTYYISHVIEMRMRAAYQLKVSKLFQL